MPPFKRISLSVHRRRPRPERLLAKAVTYRGCIAALDFLAIYLFTRRAGLALGFMLLSFLYTAAIRFVHERVWTHLVEANSAA